MNEVWFYIVWIIGSYLLGMPPDDPGIIQRRVDYGPPRTGATRWAYAPNAVPAASAFDAGVVQ